ncbi:hypothetical protein GUJ93_ZPchr0006g45270 [Zizania palustris]|uniref:Uncharacterized protein n=1 Tax=Zizania palustris TaxID=103762 RepID=A0A8J5SRW1_ZIZPA|nr:hypothetical protein GUJ93_ZPchr0006g45270 [Zizania palustris]
MSDRRTARYSFICLRAVALHGDVCHPLGSRSPPSTCNSSRDDRRFFLAGADVVGSSFSPRAASADDTLHGRACPPPIMPASSSTQKAAASSNRKLAAAEGVEGVVDEPGGVAGSAQRVCQCHGRPLALGAWLALSLRFGVAGATPCCCC